VEAAGLTIEQRRWQPRRQRPVGDDHSQRLPRDQPVGPPPHDGVLIMDQCLPQGQPPYL
jgi:hypothetical protein